MTKDLDLEDSQRELRDTLATFVSVDASSWNAIPNFRRHRLILNWGERRREWQKKARQWRRLRAWWSWYPPKRRWCEDWLKLCLDFEELCGKYLSLLVHT